MQGTTASALNENIKYHSNDIQNSQEFRIFTEEELKELGSICLENVDAFWSKEASFLKETERSEKLQEFRIYTKEELKELEDCLENIEDFWSKEASFL